MSAANGRRAALVAALLGLLAFLVGAAAPAASGGAPSASVTTSQAVALGDHVEAVGPTSTVGGTARTPQPVAVRTTHHDRSATAHPGGWALGASLLVLAGVLLLVGVRRACRPSTTPAWRRGLATRAPPALAL